nr:pseudouridine synthase [Thermovirga lienii]
MKDRMREQRNMDMEANKLRLNRYLALCGLGSRRSVEELIRTGRVKINGKLAQSFHVKVASDDCVEVDGNRVRPLNFVYLVFHKPPGYVCAVKDRHNATIFSLLPGKYNDLGLFPVGRLDKMSEGLLILTNDGELSFNLTHPSSRIVKTYEVLMDRPLRDSDIMRLKRGATVEGLHVAPIDVTILERPPYGRWVKIRLGEGRKREIRVMALEAKLKVIRLIRRAIGKMILKELSPGAYKEVTLKDLMYLIRSGGFV